MQRCLSVDWQLFARSKFCSGVSISAEGMAKSWNAKLLKKFAPLSEVEVCARYPVVVSACGRFIKNFTLLHLLRWVSGIIGRNSGEK